MKLILLDEKYELKNTQNSVRDIMQYIEQKQEESGIYVSCLRLDGVEIYGDYEKVLRENIQTIEEVQVSFKTITDMCIDILISSINYLKGVLPQIKAIGSSFYEVPTEKAWQDLADVFGGLQWLLESTIAVNVHQNVDQAFVESRPWKLYVQKVVELSQRIPELQKAISLKDTIFIADLLIYEFSPAFEEMIDLLQELCPQNPDTILN